MVDIKWCGMVCGHQDKSELILHLSQLQFEFDLAGFTNDLYIFEKTCQLNQRFKSKTKYYDILTHSFHPFLCFYHDHTHMEPDTDSSTAEHGGSL